MPRARGIGMPKKRSSSPSSTKIQAEATPPPPPAVEGGPAPSDSIEPTRTDVPQMTRVKMECLAATRLVKLERKVLESVVRTLEKCGKTLERVTKREEKAMQVLERPPPPLARVPPAKQLRLIQAAEARLDKAGANFDLAYQAVMKQQVILAAAKMLSREKQNARLRSLLRKHRVPMKDA